MENKQPYTTIYSSLKANNLKTWGAIILAGLAILGSAIFSFLVYQESKKNIAFIDGNGDALPVKWAEREKVIAVEIASHINLWCNTFHSFDMLNIDERLESGLLLIDQKSGNYIYDYYEGKGWYDEVKKNNADQRTYLVPSTLQINDNVYPYQWKATAITRIDNSGQVRFFSMDMGGLMKEITRSFPENPHGLMIYNYQEKNKKVLDGLTDKAVKELIKE